MEKFLNESVIAIPNQYDMNVKELTFYMIIQMVFLSLLVKLLK